MALFRYYDIATVRNQHQLLTCKIQHGGCYYFKSYYFRIIIKHLTKCNIFCTFAFKNYEKFTDHTLKKLCFRFLASTFPVVGFERVCPKKVGPWPRILESLALASNVVSSTLPLALVSFQSPLAFNSARLEC